MERLETIVERLLQLPAMRRRAALDEACGSDRSLRAAVEARLGLDGSSSSSVGSASGDRVGAWELIRPLGAGGMGEVWLAERAEAEFRQRAALKLVKRGMDTDLVLDRFRRERRVLAQLEHAGIPRLIDGGAALDGRPFLVMEHVEGRPIDVHARERQLDVPARLRLFLSVCDAVIHAHEQGVVHRDLKPSNVLVTEAGEPRLLDFGIAKVLGTDGEEAAIDLTRTGGQHLTPRYASPEQVRGEPVTAASDVYALGLLLWELLVGRPAVRLEGVTLADQLQVLCERDVPRPSAALAGERTRLRRALSGDLDTICGMALRKEPERRYASVALLAEDVRRHLTARPVLARPEGFTYRASRFVRRNRLLVGATAAVVLALAGGLSIALLQYRAALRAGRAAEHVAYGASLEAAEAALRIGDAAAAQASLAAAPERLRGWEWRHLAARLDGSSFTSPPLVSMQRARSIAWLEGETFAYGDGRDLVVRDLEREHWRVPDALPTAIAFAPGSGRLAWCDHGGGVWVLNAAAGPASRRGWVEKVEGAFAYDHGVDLAWSPDERWLAFSHYGGLRLLDGATGALVHAFPDERGDDTSNRIAWHPAGELLVRGRWEETVQIFDAARGARVGEWRAHTMAVQDLNFDATGELLVTGSLDRTVKVWEFATQRLLATSRRSGSVASVLFAPGGDEVLCGESNGALQRFEWRSDEPRAVLVGHTSPPYALAFSRDGSRLASAGQSCALRVWEAQATDVPAARTCEFINSVRAAPDGTRFVTASPDGFLRLWDTATCRMLSEADLGRGVAYDVDWSPDGRQLASGHEEGAVALWDAADLTLLRVFEDHSGHFTNAVAFSPDGAALTSVHTPPDGGHSHLRLWALEPGVVERRIELGLNASVGSVDLVTRPGGLPLALGHRRSAPATWGPDGLPRRVDGSSEQDCWSVGLDADRRRLVLAQSEEILVVDARDLRVLTRWPAPVKHVHAAVWHPSGERIALAVRNRIEIWDPRVPSRTAVLQGHADQIDDLSWTSDGETLISVSWDGAVRVWSTR